MGGSLTDDTTYLIGAVLETDYKTDKADAQFRVSREVTVIRLNFGQPMLLGYTDGHGTLVTTSVVNWSEDDSGLWVTTHNSVYRLDYYKPSKAVREAEFIF